MKVNINLQSKQTLEVTQASGTTTFEDTLSKACVAARRHQQCMLQIPHRIRLHNPVAVIFLGPAIACLLPRWEALSLGLTSDHGVRGSPFI
jgi:hypothetical protein